MIMEGVLWKGRSGTEHLVQVEISYREDNIFVMNTLDKLMKLFTSYLAAALMDRQAILSISNFRTSPLEHDNELP